MSAGPHLALAVIGYTLVCVGFLMLTVELMRDD